VKIYKTISSVLHPIAVPTVVVTLYFITVPINFRTDQKWALLSLVFVATYIVPLLLMIVLKQLNMISTFKTKTIEQRKFPIAFMAILFYLLANTITSVSALYDLGLFFYAITATLGVTYVLFFFKIKLSIHLISLGVSIGYFLTLSQLYNQSYLLLTMVFFLISGIVANARLHLKAHNVSEIYLGFFLGLLTPLAVYLIL
jgi:hypothetical protein